MRKPIAIQGEGQTHHSGCGCEAAARPETDEMTAAPAHPTGDSSQLGNIVRRHA